MRTKQTIPDDEDTAKVLVDAVAVDAVVYSVVTWCVQNVFQRTYLANCLHTNIIYRTGTRSLTRDSHERMYTECHK